MWNNSLRELWNIAPFGRNVKWNSPLHICEANISQRSYFTWALPYFTRRRRISLKKAHIVLVDKCVLFSGGGWWIRTTEVSDNRFTVCPLWPLGKSPIFGLDCCPTEWSWWTESNHQPADYKSAALPLSHTSKKFAFSWNGHYYITGFSVCQYLFEKNF